MNQPKKPHPSLEKTLLSGDQSLPIAMPILRKKTIFSPEKVCAYMAAVLTGDLVMADEKPPAVLVGRKK